MLRIGEIKDGYTLTAFLLDQHLKKEEPRFLGMRVRMRAKT
jgi:hypothetical protein